MKKILLFLVVSATFSQAQNFRGLDKSPMDQAKFPASNRISEKIAIITYSRPQLRGRTFEEVVPQNKIWRTGANEATEIRLFADVQFGDTKVSAGTYSVFTIVGEKAVTFILNRGTNLWGAYAYSLKKDVLRMDVPRATAKESLEAFSIAFSNKEEQPKIHMGWGNVRLAIPFTVL